MPDWVLFFIVVVGVPVVAGIGGDMFKRWIKLKEAQLKAVTEQTADRVARAAAHSELLEERVRVLERIVTDRGLAVSEEIEKLRDRPVN